MNSAVRCQGRKSAYKEGGQSDTRTAIYLFLRILLTFKSIISAYKSDNMAEEVKAMCWWVLSALNN
jgi:hypothetical protein